MLLLYFQVVHEEGNPFDKFAMALRTSEERVEPVTVGHIPLEISRHVYYFMKEEEGVVSAQVQSTVRRRSLISQGGLEIPISLSCHHEQQEILDVLHDACAGVDEGDDTITDVLEPVTEKLEPRPHELSLGDSSCDEDGDLLLNECARKKRRIINSSADEDDGVNGPKGVLSLSGHSNSSVVQLPAATSSTAADVRSPTTPATPPSATMPSTSAPIVPMMSHETIPALRDYEYVSTQPPLPFSFFPVDEDWQYARCSSLALPLPLSGHPTQLQVCVSNLTPPLNPVPIIGDGNCFFRAISHVLSGNEDHHRQFRDVLCTFTAKNCASFAQYTDCGRDLDHIVSTNMRKDRVWATQVEVYAAATLLNTSVYVFMKTGPVLAWNKHEPVAECVPPGVWPTKKAIYLKNAGGCHYEPVFKLSM